MVMTRGEIQSPRAFDLGPPMQRMDLERFTTDELWALRQKVAATLASRLTAEMKTIENRLRQLDGPIWTRRLRKTTGRRFYPTVAPKFRNPDQPSQTWAGRGKQPRWLTAHLSSGKRIDDFRIEQAAA
jgi:DNA-binding protein H-NS